jgi:hypothetical protein
VTRWFELVPTVETIAIQLLAGGFVIGSYYLAKWWVRSGRHRTAAQFKQKVSVPPSEMAGA